MYTYQCVDQISGKHAKLSTLLKVFMSAENKAIEYIEDWGVENTTLEQVFVDIVHEDAANKAAGRED